MYIYIMSYPTSCGSNGEIVDISIDCLKDLWKSSTDKNCTTSLAAANVPNAFTLVGSTPNLLTFSTYGQTLEQVSSNIDVAQNFKVLCNSDTYLNSSDAGKSNNQILISNNAELNGLAAQYSYLYHQYINLLERPPSNISTTIQSVENNSYLYTSNPTVDNSNNLARARQAADTALNAYNSMISSIKADIDTIYARISTLANTIHNSLIEVGREGNRNEETIENNVTNLMNKINAMNVAFTNLKTETEKPSELDGNYEVAQIKTKSNFMKHLLYIIFALLIAGCLIFIQISPTEGRLDMFILGLGVIIFTYYVYDYYDKRKK